MVLNYLFTGLIAALLSVPGTGQKEVATVGEEPMVKEKLALAEEWFIYNTGSPSNETEATTAGNYRRLSPTESIESLCAGTNDICAVKVPPQSTNTNLPDFSSSGADAAKQQIQNHFGSSTDPVDEEVMRLKP